MPQDLGERPNTVPWPPLIYSAALLIAWALERWDPFVWMDDHAAGSSRTGSGWSSSARASPWISGRSSRSGAAPPPCLPNAKSRVLVQTGPYRFSRNPIYLGNTLAMLGLALALRWGWLVLLVPVTITAVNWLAISREEHHLDIRFGAEWRAYAAKVRRWL